MRPGGYDRDKQMSGGDDDDRCAIPEEDKAVEDEQDVKPDQQVKKMAK